MIFNLFNLFPTKHIIRSKPDQVKTVYLTFDDGPSEITPQVLVLLRKYNFKGTFFVIGHKAFQNKSLIQQALNDGHAVYSHSKDHDYSNYFRSDERVGHWMSTSIFELQTLTQNNNLYFRPPAGILTPPLLRASLKKNISLILWSQRFYDSVFQLNRRKISKYLSRIKDGDIVLLHDQQREKNISVFLDSFEFFLAELQKKGYACLALT